MTRSSVKINFLYQTAYEILVLFLPFITSPYVARVIGAEGLGVYSFSYSVAYYFVLFSMLGIKNYGNRIIAQCQNDSQKCSKIFCNIYAVHFICTVCCLILYVGYVHMLEDDQLYAFIQIVYVISALFDISWFYFGIEQFRFTVSVSIICKAASVLCILLFVRSADDLWKYCLIMASSVLINNVVLWFPLRKYINWVKPTWNEMRCHIKPLVLLFVPVVAVSLYKYMDKIMVGILSSKEQLGFYENAEKVINAPLSIITAFGNVMLPRMSRLMHSANNKVTEKYISISVQYIMCLAFALAFGLAGVGPVFAPVFWGSIFSPSGMIISGLAITIPFIAFANVIRTQYLIPLSKDYDYLISVMTGAVVNLYINSRLIPTMGAYGATIGTIVAEITVCCIQVFTVRKQLPILYYTRRMAVFFSYGIFMFIFTRFIGWLFGESVITLLLQVFLGGAIYVCASLVYLYNIKDETLLDMMNAIRKLNKKIL